MVSDTIHSFRYSSKFFRQRKEVLVSYQTRPTLVILSPEYTSNGGVSKRTRKLIEKASAKKKATAYSKVIKYGIKKGIELLALKQFKDSLDAQINQNMIHALKDEEWLLESVGLGTLKNNNLLPAAGNTVRIKDVYEAFLRFDDIPMIVGKEAITDCKESATQLGLRLEEEE